MPTTESRRHVLLIALLAFAMACTSKPQVAERPKPASPTPPAPTPGSAEVVTSRTDPPPVDDSAPAPAPDSSPRCRPLDSEAWLVLCATEPAEVARLIGLFGAAQERVKVTNVEEARALLSAGEGADLYELALQQLLTLMLNMTSGRVDADCCIDGGDPRGFAVQLAIQTNGIRPRSPSCEAARAFMLRANHSARIRPCLPDGSNPNSNGCRARTAEDWAELCDDAEGLHRIDGLLIDARRLQGLADIETAEQACDLLRLGNDAGSCQRARREAMVGTMSIAAGTFGPACCVELPTGVEPVIPVLIRLSRASDEGSGPQCDEAVPILEALNRGEGVRYCAPGTPGLAPNAVIPDQPR